MDGWVGGGREGWIDDWVRCERLCSSSSSCGLRWEIFLRPADSKAEPKVSEVKWGPLKSISFSTEERKPVKLPHANASQNSNFVFFLEPQHQGYWKSGCTTHNAWAARRVLERWHWENSTDLASNPWAGGALRKDIWLCSREMQRIVLSEGGTILWLTPLSRTVEGSELGFYGSDGKTKAHRDQGIWLASGPGPSLGKSQVLWYNWERPTLAMWPWAYHFPSLRLHFSAWIMGAWYYLAEHMYPKW